MIKEVVYELAGYSWLNAREFIDGIQGVLDSIPEEYRENANVQFSAWDDYGTPVPSLELYYERPQNDAEKMAEWSRNAEADERERAEYLRLKAKFEP